MIIQAVQRLVELVNNNTTVREYDTVYDPISKKTFYECVTYTYKGTLETFQDKGQNIDTKA
jgi:uncharacterized protein (DUF433 family)